MKYFKCPEGSYVFKYGDIGDLYYIVLKGKVSVKTPFNTKMSMTEK